jgi:hypothetical protein
MFSNITHVFNYECSFFTILCNTRSLKLYGLLFVPFDSLNTAINVSCSLQVLEILLEAVDFQNRKQVVPGPLVSLSLYRGRQGLPSISRRPISRPGTTAALLAGAHVPR